MKNALIIIELLLVSAISSANTLECSVKEDILQNDGSKNIELTVPATSIALNQRTQLIGENSACVVTQNGQMVFFELRDLIIGKDQSGNSVKAPGWTILSASASPMTTNTFSNISTFNYKVAGEPLIKCHCSAK